MIDVKLKSLLAVVSEGSFTRAAEKLSLSQPAVSYQLRQLEDEYSIKIFF
ncbi:MAG: LysR family transcriptional regulator, partial [Clostridia bacterium]|nr:LysR family transcriptional regulator [Clostridia bacterium]